MNISYLKNKNIHFVECENWHDAYGYEKSEMKEDTINYIEKLQQENEQLKDNWNMLKEFIVKEYYMYLPLEASAKSITILIDKIQELEQGSDS